MLIKCICHLLNRFSLIYSIRETSLSTIPPQAEANQNCTRGEASLFVIPPQDEAKQNTRAEEASLFVNPLKTQQNKTGPRNPT